MGVNDQARPAGAGAERRVRIAHVITSLDVGGAEIMLTKLLKATDRERFHNMVVTLTGNDTLKPAIQTLGVEFRHVAMTPSPIAFISLAKLAYTLRSFKPDLVQGWMYHGNIAGVLGKMLGRLRCPLLWNIRHALHNIDLVNRRTAFLIRGGKALAHTTEKIIYNAATAARQHEAFGYGRDRTVIIPNGFDTTRFRPDVDAAEALRRELHIDDHLPLIGLIGRHDPHKDHDTFFTAMQLMEKESGQKARYILAGRGIDWENKTLAASARMLPSAGHIHLMGERRDTHQIMAALDLLALSSRSESFPNVVGEAMSCGVPCVVTNVGDAPEIVGNTGLVVPPGDPNALANAVLSMLRMAPEEKLGLGRCARERIKRIYAIEKIADDYTRLYLQIVNSSPCVAS